MQVACFAADLHATRDQGYPGAINMCTALDAFFFERTNHIHGGASLRNWSLRVTSDLEAESPDPQMAVTLEQKVEGGGDADRAAAFASAEHVVVRSICWRNNKTSHGLAADDQESKTRGTAYGVAAGLWLHVFTSAADREVVASCTRELASPSWKSPPRAAARVAIMPFAWNHISS